ncbi:MAG: Smr/MutS family protein, partial [Acidobacteria bacterium]|nr:Smr/MutS family protein [Acidobacteriota bacterium]MDW7985192.1 Smr/MutS family protein [Acidobacteriota bacterium]
RQIVLQEILQTYERAGRPTLRFLPDLRAIVRTVRLEGACLTPEELWTAVAFFDQVDALVRAFRPHRTQMPHIARWLDSLPTMAEFRSRVRAALTPSGEVLETATPGLQRISQSWRQLRAQIEHRLRVLIERPDSASAIQEPILTQREHRWVLLVKADQQHRIPGIVLGTSGSGASVYLEPLEVVELNNRYVLLEEERRAEVQRVLRQLTNDLRAVSNWSRLFGRLARLDALLAMAAYAQAYEATVPCVEATDRLVLDRARHPLLAIQARTRRQAVVPLDLEMDDRAKVLIITGPNAGGKTVVLKTVGLMVLMAQAGLPVPAGAGTRLPCFSHVMADIGDQQDLAQNLSTFASHVRRLIPMLTTPVRRGLFLIDELGTGTDPAEGAALGAAVLKHLRGQPGKILVVTHLTSIKLMAFQETDIITASMEFAPETLAPTFRLIPHAFGASHALDIARRYGLPEVILEEAYRALDPNHLRWMELVHRLEAAQRAVEAQRVALEREQQEQAQRYQARLQQLEQVQAGLMQEWLTWKQRVQQWWEERQQAWLAFLHEVQDPAVRQALRQRFQTVRRQFLQEAADVLRIPPPLAAGRPADWSPGMAVRLRNASTTGTLEAVDAQRAVAVVRFRDKRLQVPLAWLEPTSGDSPPPAAPTPEDINRMTPPADREVYLLGLHVPDALDRLDQALDRAYRQGLRRLRVIHGYRPGRLKQAVLEHLRHHPMVERFEPAPPQEGGPGATIVFLKP